MPRVIVKCRFYSTEKTVRDISGLLKYFATRPGVEKLGDGWLNEPVSKAQEDLIMRFTEMHKGCRRLQEYGDYNTKRTKGAASEFISAVIENFPELLSDKTYLDYIATRPRVERIEGTHGLFSDHDVALDLYEESDRLREFNGNVFTVIVSLKREDAERLGYNTAERWRELARSKIDLVAKEHGIPLGSLKWYGAFHNESHHPHMHLMLYSTSQEKRGFIDKKGIDRLRHLFGTEMFKYELADVYDEQTKQRDLLNADARDEITALADKIKNGLADNGEFVMKFVALAKRMQSVSGKKVYGYLPKSVKAMVNELVDLLEKDEDINRIYELWYQAKCAVYATYTDNPQPRKPLSQEEAFKPIRNAMIKEADELGKILFILDNDQEEQSKNSTEDNDDDKSSNGGSSSHTTNNTTSSTQNTNTAQPKSHSNYTAARNGYIATSITRFGNSLSRIFRDRFDEQAKHAPMGVDSRLKREIEAKKKGQNISM